MQCPNTGPSFSFRESKLATLIAGVVRAPCYPNIYNPLRPQIHNQDPQQRYTVVRHRPPNCRRQRRWSGGVGVNASRSVAGRSHEPAGESDGGVARPANAWPCCFLVQGSLFANAMSLSTPELWDAILQSQKHPSNYNTAIIQGLNCHCALAG